MAKVKVEEVNGRHPLRDIEQNAADCGCDNSQCVDEETGCGLGREIRKANIEMLSTTRTIKWNIRNELKEKAGILSLNEAQMKEAIRLRLGIFTKEEREEAFKALGADTPEKRQLYRTELTETEQKLFEEKVFDRWASSTPFPFTSKICAAPCQSSCTKASRILPDGRNEDPVAIRMNELTACLVGMRYNFFDKYFPSTGIPEHLHQKNIAVVGSGPAGLAAAYISLLDGHKVTIFERDSRFGGLLTFGIPDKKLDKIMVEHFLELFQKMERLTMLPNREFRVEDRKNFDLTVLATGVMDSPRKHEKEEVNDHPNVVQAMPFLTQHNEFVYRQRFQQPYQRTIELKPGQVTIVAGAGDTSIDAITVAGEQQDELVKKGLDAGTVIAIDRNIKRTQKSPEGAKWPRLRETIVPERQEAIDHAVKAEEQYAVRIANVYPSAKGVPVTHVQFEYLKPEKPVMETLSKEHRKMVRDTSRGGSSEKKQNLHPGTNAPSEAGTKWKPVDNIILAYGSEGMKENTLVKALGLKVDPKSGKILDVRNNMTSLPNVLIAGDCDPTVRRWTVEAAQGSALTCGEAIRLIADNPRKTWEECRNAKLQQPRKSLALEVGRVI